MKLTQRCINSLSGPLKKIGRRSAFEVKWLEKPPEIISLVVAVVWLPLSPSVSVRKKSQKNPMNLKRSFWFFQPRGRRIWTVLQLELNCHQDRGGFAGREKTKFGRKQLLYPSKTEQLCAKVPLLGRGPSPPRRGR